MPPSQSGASRVLPSGAGAAGAGPASLLREDAGRREALCLGFTAERDKAGQMEGYGFLHYVIAVAEGVIPAPLVPTTCT